MLIFNEHNQKSHTCAYIYSCACHLTTKIGAIILSVMENPLMNKGFVWDRFVLSLCSLFSMSITSVAYAHFEHKHLLERIWNFQKWILRIKVSLESASWGSKLSNIIFPGFRATEVEYRTMFMKNCFLAKCFTRVSHGFRTWKLVTLSKKACKIQKT